MAKPLLECACSVRRDNKIVPFPKLLSSDNLLTEVGKSFTTKEWLARIPEETWQELLRLHSRWNKIKFKNESGRRDLENACAVARARTTAMSSC
jgi:hypothetical protein